MTNWLAHEILHSATTQDMHPDAIAWAHAHGNDLGTPATGDGHLDAGTSRYGDGRESAPSRSGNGRSRRTATPAVRPATDNQLAAIIKWGGNKVLTDELATVLADAIAGIRPTFTQASAIMDAPWKPRETVEVPTPSNAVTVTTDKVTEPGMYRVGETVYRVVRGENGLYAKTLTDDGFIYERGAITRITAAARMTLDEAKAYGRETGTCCVCSKVLTNPKSVLAGIGPVCAGRV